MVTNGFGRAAPLALGLALLLAGAAGVQAADYGRSGGPGETRVSITAPSRNVVLGIGKSYVIDLPRDASEVLVADPKIANAVVRSARRAYIIGAAIGETDVIFFDSAGEQIVALGISVGRDLGALRSNIDATVRGGQVRVRGIGDTVMLTGSVQSAADAQTASDLAARLVGDPQKVVSALSIEGREQVMLKVTVAELQRSALKQFGVDLSAAGNFGSLVANPLSPGGIAMGALAAAIAPSYPINSAAPTNSISGQYTRGDGALRGTIRALEQKQLMRTLAEPTLMAISGETADFLAGGEFPVPTGQDQSGRVTIEFKRYGVGLNFTPVVLSDGRISLKITTEVSELSNEGAFTLGAGTNSTIVIPGLRVRRANTTVELPSGGSMILAGLLQDSAKQAADGLPGLMNIPVLGTLFRSRDFQRGQTELVVLVTPYLAKPVNRKELARPDDNLALASDPSAILLGRFNKIYGDGQKPAPAAAASYRGPYGFIH